ncbi:MAG: manganese efflux pump [Polyangiaceae bacterium]|nr:manganese efflux pump [Polyangiaceae bacterium]
MDFPSLLALSVGLAMDATAVSAARGLAVPQLRVRHAVKVALFFGGFQAGMPLAGWALGSGVGPYVAAWDHWIAFALLAGIGLKMLHEARQAGGPPEGRSERELFGLRVMLVLAVATSIDAFAVGITLPMLDAPLAVSLTTIGVTTAVLSALGLVAGRRFGALLGRRLDAFGGLVLVALGVKILVEHLSA